ncbi:MAG: crossover junction endodeoxyribonuclease RuvC [Clostridia bacterium]|nr:crossover junction endodeoxyribonuclease RuvC [Clostridia bacterium]MBP5173871.1 crossover junction endodeoxyribonuclease RuvC [Clostridia bacterium]
MVILGIDPGLATVGWGVIKSEGSRLRPVAYGALTTEPGVPTERRLSLIFRDMGGLIERYSPDAVSVEELFFNTNITTGIRVAEARGVILLCAENYGVPVFEYTPLQAKQAVVGYGRAEKRQIISMVTRLLSLPEPPSPDDAADALAIAICHAHSGASRIAGYYNK